LEQRISSSSRRINVSTTSNLSQNARETLKEAREGVSDIGNAASDASSNIQKDLQALRDDFARLAEQVSAIFADKSNSAWQRAKSSVDGVVSDAQSKGQDAAAAMREVSDNLVGALDDSIKEHPYTTLAIVAGLGFLFGATWRR
jgi:ElaB/YqjD/DUF883 family membrane-anchored ribosome-binding protein